MTGHQDILPQTTVWFLGVWPEGGTSGRDPACRLPSDAGSDGQVWRAVHTPADPVFTPRPDERWLTGPVQSRWCTHTPGST